MGSWGIDANECDKAEEWLVDLWRDYPVYKGIREGLELDAESNYEEVRMAAEMLMLVAPFCSIPIEEFESTFDLAIIQMKKVKEQDVYIDLDDFQKIIEEEIKQLQSYRNSSSLT